MNSSPYNQSRETGINHTIRKMIVKLQCGINNTKGNVLTVELILGSKKVFLRNSRYRPNLKNRE